MGITVTQLPIYHNKITNVHDLDSYIMFLKCAWMQYAEVITGLILFGFICGIILMKFYINRKNISISEVI